MLRNTILTFAAAAALCFAVSAVSNGAAADPTAERSKSHPTSGGNGTLAGAGGASTQCFEAECGGDTVPIDDNYVVRGCAMTPADQPLPPWCESATGAQQHGKAVIAK